MQDFINGGHIIGNTSAEQLENYLAKVASAAYESLKSARLARLEVEAKLEQAMLIEDQANAEWLKANAELDCFAKVVAEHKDRTL